MIGTLQPRVNLIAPYDPLPWQVAPWRDRSRVVLLTGSAGGGKSRLAAEKLHGYCLKYPGAFALVVRKTRVSLTKGSILFLKKTVIGPDPAVTHLESKDYFVYRNGSILAYMGLEDEAQRERLKSIGPAGGVDIVWGEEATELEEEDHNALLGRLRGNAAPWRQILYTCNPDAPLHWIKRRLMDGGEAKVYYSRAADNRHNPEDYLETLDTLTGIDDLRLNKGLWVTAQGSVYAAEWQDGGEGGSVTEAADYVPGGGAVYWALDDGYSAGSAPATRGRDRHGMFVADAHPRVILWCQARPDGQIAVFAESYACQVLSDDHISEALQEPYPRPDAVVHGPGSAEIKGRLFEAGLMPAQSTADVAESIKELRRRLAPDKNGWRGIIVHPRCVHLRHEMASYAIDPATDRPIKAYDHGPDALRGLVWKLRGWL
jgi:phage terminase large subunit